METKGAMTPRDVAWTQAEPPASGIYWVRCTDGTIEPRHLHPANRPAMGGWWRSIYPIEPPPFTPPPAPSDVGRPIGKLGDSCLFDRHAWIEVRANGSFCERCRHTLSMDGDVESTLRAAIQYRERTAADLRKTLEGVRAELETAKRDYGQANELLVQAHRRVHDLADEKHALRSRLPSAPQGRVEWTQEPVKERGLYWIRYCDGAIEAAMLSPKTVVALGEWRSVSRVAAPQFPAPAVAAKDALAEAIEKARNDGWDGASIFKCIELLAALRERSGA